MREETLDLMSKGLQLDKISHKKFASLLLTRVIEDTLEGVLYPKLEEMVASGEAYRQDVLEHLRHKGQIFKDKSEKKKKREV